MKAKNRLRSSTIPVLATAEEKRLMRAHAQRLGLSVGAWLRSIALAQIAQQGGER